MLLALNEPPYRHWDRNHQVLDPNYEVVEDTMPVIINAHESQRHVTLSQPGEPNTFTKFRVAGCSNSDDRTALLVAGDEEKQKNELCLWPRRKL